MSIRKSGLPKVSVIGSGIVGMAFAYGATLQGLAREMVLMDVDVNRAEGEAMDLSHATAYLGSMGVRAGDATGDYEECRGSEVFVVTAGKAQKPGQTRMELLAANAEIIIGIMKKIEAVSEDPVVIIVTNPVDVMTAVAVQAGNFIKGRVFGSGTVLDTARFRRLLADQCRVDAKSVHAHVLGEHGDSEVCVWSRANVSNVPLREYCDQRGTKLTEQVKQSIDTDVRRAAYEIIDRKGATAYGIGVSLCRILEGIVRDAKTILTVSAPAGHIYGLSDDVCLSLPCILGAGGVEQVLETKMEDDELAALKESGRLIHEACDELREAGILKA